VQEPFLLAYYGSFPSVRDFGCASGSHYAGDCGCVHAGGCDLCYGSGCDLCCGSGCDLCCDCDLCWNFASDPCCPAAGSSFFWVASGFLTLPHLFCRFLQLLHCLLHSQKIDLLPVEQNVTCPSMIHCL
jgi:hypothetical protein